ncbi:sugar phosphate nucleotidyltransferase [Vulcanisaeta thermophila]|uniref:sugar phosphate nucleotidyltransferase n=1 Tax=Vulcanisaeta thermophila TaxID=867917 RepID=UPI00117FFE4C|nr:NDP-sugar synthase [Vulcanisaeta thermophila]
MREIEVVGVVLGGGKGTKMEPITPYVDKALIRLMGKPLIYYPTKSLIDLGLRRIYVVSRDPSKISSELSKYTGSAPVEHMAQRGDDMSSALASIYEVAGKGTVVISFGDVVMPTEAYRLALNTHVNSGKSVTVLMTPLSDLQGYFEVSSTGDSVLISKVETHRSGYAWAGVLVTEGDFIRTLHDLNGDLNGALMKFRGNINLALWSGWFVDVAYPWDLLSAIKYLMMDIKESRISKAAHISPRAVIEGPVIIDDEAVVDHGATIRGPVYLGRGSYVGNNAIIRNNTSLEEDSVVGANAEVTESLIGPRVTVGRGSFIGNSVIGDEAVIEPGVVTLSVLPSGVEVSHLTPVIVKGKQVSKLGLIAGPRCRVGANSVVYPGYIVDANKYVPPLSTLRS